MTVLIDGDVRQGALWTTYRVHVDSRPPLVLKVTSPAAFSTSSDDTYTRDDVEPAVMKEFQILQLTKYDLQPDVIPAVLGRYSVTIGKERYFAVLQEDGGQTASILEMQYHEKYVSSVHVPGSKLK